MVCADEEEKARVVSQLQILIRPMYSSPPIYGARVVEHVLTHENDLWLKEVHGMADRIISMRNALKSGLEDAGSSLSWEHITVRRSGV